MPLLFSVFVRVRQKYRVIKLIRGVPYAHTRDLIARKFINVEFHRPFALRHCLIRKKHLRFIAEIIGIYASTLTETHIACFEIHLEILKKTMS